MTRMVSDRQYGLGVKGQGQIYLRSVLRLFTFFIHLLMDGVHIYNMSADDV